MEGDLPASNDLEPRIEIARRQRDEHIGGVVGQHGGEHTRAFDPGGLERSFVGGVGCQVKIPGIPCLGDFVGAAFEDDEWRFCFGQFRCQLVADPAKTADDGVAGKLFYLRLHAVQSHQFANLEVRENLHERAGQYDHAGASKNDSGFVEGAQPRRVDGADFAVTD